MELLWLKFNCWFDCLNFDWFCQVFENLRYCRVRIIMANVGI